MMRLVRLAAFAAAGLLATSTARAYTPLPTADADQVIADQNIFLDDEVTRVDVTIPPEQFQHLLDNASTDDQFPVTMRWRNSVIDETVENVGFRARGGAFTREATRKSWKLDFNDYVPGRSFYTLESIDLNGEHNDPTFIRRRYAHEILRQMNVAAARTHYVALYINGEFWSIQVNTENIDEEFADSWFGSKDGNLYKCRNSGQPADLRKVNGEDYASLGDGQTYEETNNDPGSDYSDLVELIRELNDTTQNQRLQRLEHFINVDNVLRVFATHVGIGSWDDYWYGSNNWHLYFNSLTQRFEFFPFDYDNTLGMDYFGENWSTRNFNNWGDGGFGSTPAPLAVAMFDHSPWRQQYRRYLAQVRELLIKPENLALLDKWHAQLVPYFDGTIESGGTVGTAQSGGQHDPYFLTGLDQPATYGGGSFHTMGIKPYLNARAASLQSQLGGFSTPPLPRVFINEVLAANTVTNTDEAGEFADWIELYNDEDSAVDIGGWHLTDDVTSPTKWIVPAGTTIPAKGRLLVWADNQPGQGPLHATFALGSGGEHLGLFMDEAEGRVLVDQFAYPALQNDRSYGRFPDGAATTLVMCDPSPSAANTDATLPCGGGGEPRTPPRVFVNEVMSSNGSTIADEFGEFDDWIELYNDEDAEVDLSGMYLSDSPVNPIKWQIPEGTAIPAKGFLLVWADNGAGVQPGLHTNFALSAGGEFAGLYDNNENANQLVSSFSFPALVTDQTYGRIPDGGDTMAVLCSATPSAANDTDTQPCGGGGEPRTPPRVFVNEVMSSNGSTIQDDFGEFEDWVELYNDEDITVDLSGLYLSDNAADPVKWRIPDGTSIPSKGYLLFWADSDAATQGGLHTNFGLSGGGEFIGLFDNNENENQPIDGFDFPEIGLDRTYARFPDGDVALAIRCNPTPLAANDADTEPCGGGGEPRTPPRVFINEFMASNDAFITDENGEFDDWIELYNDEDVAVDLSGLYMTDTLATPRKWRIPDGVSIPAKGFLVIWADSQPEQGNLHASFGLSGGGEAIGLFDNDENQNQPIDTLTYGPQVADQVEGRRPDGTGPVAPIAPPTPGKTNVLTGRNGWTVMGGPGIRD